MNTLVSVAPHPRVPLTRFHNNTGEFLDLATRTPVVLTSHGRERHILLDSVYFRRLEEIARGNILAALDLEAHDSAAMPDELRAQILGSQPTAEEMASGKWHDD